MRERLEPSVKNKMATFGFASAIVFYDLLPFLLRIMLYLSEYTFINCKYILTSMKALDFSVLIVLV